MREEVSCTKEGLVPGQAYGGKPSSGLDDAILLRSIMKKKSCEGQDLFLRWRFKLSPRGRWVVLGYTKRSRLLSVLALPVKGWAQNSASHANYQ